MAGIIAEIKGALLNAVQKAWVAAGEAGGPLGTAAYTDTGDYDAAGAAAAALAASVQSVVAGTNITVDDTDPNNPIVSADSGGASDVDDLTTTTGNSTEMVRVAAAGGLEYRTVAQVLADIAALALAGGSLTGQLRLDGNLNDLLVIHRANWASGAEFYFRASGSLPTLQLVRDNGSAETVPIKIDVNEITFGMPCVFETVVVQFRDTPIALFLDTTAGNREAVQIIPTWDDSTDATRSSKVDIKAANATGYVNGIRVDDDATAGNTRFFLYDVDNGQLERVTVGGPDSGGAGYKVLRIPN